MAKEEFIVARGSIAVGYVNDRTHELVNDQGVKYKAKLGEQILVHRGGRVELDSDEAEVLLARGVIRRPGVDGDLPAPPGAALGPSVDINTAPSAAA